MFIEEIKQKFYSLMYTRKGEILFFLLLILIGLIIYKDVFFYKYTGADFFAQIAGNSNINDALAAPLSADFLGDNWYRPVDAVTIYLNYEIGGLDPFIYQLTNMIIFISAFMLLFAGSIYRMNVYLIGYHPGPDWNYFPSLAELMITIGMFSFEVVLYLIFVKRLPVLHRAEAT